ncbi:MAG: putative terminase large subunit [Prokaryotic dsDNA virus sp.]|nr:MAG: putative terminase large subunit [Prokaryotic dsDNA virus sp.]|tara:strand:+ start:8750 stop:10333 length:1584 start_codon:yes stop_codon:yes gene_type:complete
MATKQTRQQIREAAENDLFAFAKIVNYNYAYGDIHEKVFRWLTSEDASKRQLLLLPRGHLKSHCIATWTAWEITRRPWTSIVYLSAGEDLAKDQIYAIKNMMTNKVYKSLWPEMINDREGDREQWSAYSFNVDHPERKKRGIRDHTIIVKTVKSNFTGLHCDAIVFDDVVVPNNAYTETGRKEVQRALSQCTSILSPGGVIKAVGTRYHPRDAYQDMMDAKYRIWDEIAKEFAQSVPLWEVMEEVVEDHGDGTGNFLWPRQYSEANDEWYGFDIQELERIQADYRSRNEMAQFYAQYYNDPNDESTNLLDRSLFQYYDPKYITITPMGVRFKGKKLNLAAAMDVAWTEVGGSGGKAPDYTAIAVIGVDEDGYFYILDLARFRTSNFQVYYDNVISLANKWGFRKIIVESNAGGKLVAQEIQRLARENGGLLSVETKSNAGFGAKSKLMRQYAIVNPKYELRSVFHRRDGLTSTLEEELVLERPPHDDLVDALGMAMENIKPPMKMREYLDSDKKVVTDARFGGRRSR